MATERIEEIRKEASDAIGAASSTDELEELRVRFLGRKAELTQILRGIAELPADERGPVGSTRPSSARGSPRMRSTSPCPEPRRSPPARSTR